MTENSLSSVRIRTLHPHINVSALPTLFLLLLLQLSLLVSETHAKSDATGYFWHITDLHYDFTYNELEIPYSCKAINKTYGKFGDYSCDAPAILIESIIEEMKTINSHVDFIVWTGDTVLHPRMNERLVLNESKNLEIIKNCTDILKAHFPKIPLASSLGNHDLFPDAQCPIATEAPNLYFKKLAEEWLTADLIETFSKNGYYFMATKDPDLYIVNLNTLLYYNRNKLIKPNQNPDPNGQFTWLQNVLEKVRKQKKKVKNKQQIQAKEKPRPFSSFQYTFCFLLEPLTAYNIRRLVVIVDNNLSLSTRINNKEQKIIILLYDSNVSPNLSTFQYVLLCFSDLRNNNGVPIFVAPALTPWMYDYNRNPAARLVRYNVTSKQLLQITQYYVNLPKANEKGQVLLEQEYIMPESYDLDDLSAASLLKLRNRMQTDDKLFKQYLQNMYVNAKTEPKIQFSKELQTRVLCSIDCYDEHSYEMCISSGAISYHSLTYISNFFLLVIYFRELV
eukprot:XP_014781055.1 PREDICTED: acid sphingomyelinase-like phosphodiesterase 3a [Octopus bimaculoides]